MEALVREAKTLSAVGVQRGSLGAVRKRLRNTLTRSQQRQSRLADYLAEPASREG